MIQPIPKSAPAKGIGSRRKRLGTLRPDAPPIFIYEDVLQQILDFSETDRRREVGGFLLGGWHSDGREYVEIRQFLPAVDARSKAASLTFTHDTWARLNREREERFPEELVLGWQHTHPGLGVFLSAYDLFLHRHYFSQPYQVAMVVDPQRSDLGFFQWRLGEIVDCGFICVLSSGPSKTSWS